MPLFVLGCLLICAGAYAVDGLAHLVPDAEKRRDAIVNGTALLAALVHVAGYLVVAAAGVQYYVNR